MPSRVVVKGEEGLQKKKNFRPMLQCYKESVWAAEINDQVR